MYYSRTFWQRKLYFNILPGNYAVLSAVDGVKKIDAGLSKGMH